MPPISHLLFADDAMSNRFEAGEVDLCISKYVEWSGQSINMQKSFLHFSTNMEVDQKNRICEILRLRQGNSDGMYL